MNMCIVGSRLWCEVNMVWQMFCGSDQFGSIIFSLLLCMVLVYMVFGSMVMLKLFLIMFCSSGKLKLVICGCRLMWCIVFFGLCSFQCWWVLFLLMFRVMWLVSLFGFLGCFVWLRYLGLVISSFCIWLKLCMIRLLLLFSCECMCRVMLQFLLMMFMWWLLMFSCSCIFGYCVRNLGSSLGSCICVSDIGMLVCMMLCGLVLRWFIILCVVWVLVSMVWVW